jgi:hypothetical protein
MCATMTLVKIAQRTMTNANKYYQDKNNRMKAQDMSMVLYTCPKTIVRKLQLLLLEFYF